MIEIKEVTKIFDGKNALDNISLNIESGSIYGIIGSNGSGKSTLLRLISGVYRTDAGSIKVDGEECFDNPRIKSRIAFLGDTPYFLPQSNLKEMKSFYASMYQSFDEELYSHYLSVFPLDEKARLSSFSKGMQRQAALILSLSSAPDYILLDEAFDGLDVVMRRVLSNILADAVEERNTTAIIASHNLRELEDMCDHVGLIHNGKALMDGNIDALASNLHKIQLAFKNVPDISVFSALNTIKIERTGSFIQLVAEGDENEIMAFTEKLSPVFSECIKPTLEEMFVYKLEANGYDVKNILE